MDGPGTPDVPLYALVALENSGYPPDRITMRSLPTLLRISDATGTGHRHDCRPRSKTAILFRTRRWESAPYERTDLAAEAQEIDERIGSCQNVADGGDSDDGGRP